MKLSDRLEIIIKEVQVNGSAKVTELSERLGCSEVTVRNDIRKLDEQGVLKKTYGGAVKIDKGLSVDFVPGECFLNSDHKYRIAKQAYEYIKNRESVMLDDSTTAYYLAKYMKEHPEKHVVVVTNSLISAAELSTAKHIDLFMVGGQIIGNPPSSLDNIAVQAMRQFHVDKAFVGVNGINLKVGLTSMGTPQMDVKREIIKMANETYVLADSSKFGTSNLFTVCPMKDVCKVITDIEVTKETVSLAKKTGVDIDVV